MAAGALGFTITGENLVPLSSFLKTSTTPGTAVKINATETACAFAVIQALVSNTKNVVIGSSDVKLSTHQGIELEPGQAQGISTKQFFNDWFLDVGTSGEGISVQIFG